jgi:D-glycero-alpha-D-manno-heptose-7-phosphate kinase
VAEGKSAAELAKQAEGALIGEIAGEMELPPVEVRVRSDSPRGGGLGASSALAVAVIAAAEAFTGGPATSAEKRSALARDLEARLMGLPTGRQDHYAALLGGVLEVAHRPGGERIRRLGVDLEALSASLVVAYTGESHFSAGSNWRVVRRRLEGDREIIGLFDGIRDVARQVGPSLMAGDLRAVGRLMSEEWSLRRRLAEGVSTPSIERLLEAGMEAGAWGGKACGAGGGGSIALFCPAARRSEVAERLAAGGAEVLRAQPVATSLTVEVLEARS